MNRLSLLGKALPAVLAVSFVAFTMPAAAQVQAGTLEIEGTQAPKCKVHIDGNPDAEDFGGNVFLGPLDGADGRLLPSEMLSAAFAAAGAFNLAYRIMCSGTNAIILVDANPLRTIGSAPPGFANRVDYIAVIDVTTVTGTQVITNDSAALPSLYLISTRFANGGTNFVVNAGTFRTPGSTDVMLGGAYTGTINIIVAPNG